MTLQYFSEMVIVQWKAHTVAPLDDWEDYSVFLNDR